MPDNGSTLPRRQLGRYLLDWRSRAGLTQAEAAELLDIGSTSLHRLERGLNGRVKVHDVAAACELYGVPEKLTEAFCGLAQQANVKSWWHEFGDLIPADFDLYMGLEAASTAITSYHMELVPGVLQKADYTRALVRDGRPDESPADHERRVQMRQHRQLLITRRIRPATVEVVLHESVLRRVIGSRKVMASQLRSPRRHWYTTECHCPGIAVHRRHPWWSCFRTVHDPQFRNRNQSDGSGTASRLYSRAHRGHVSGETTGHSPVL